MGRPSKLTPAQWAEVERRLLAGETTRAIGSDYGVAESAIRKRFGAHKSISAQSAQVIAAAEKIAEANVALAELPPGQRPIAIDIGATMTRTLTSVMEAAALGADTGRRLHQVANKAAQDLDMGDLDQVKVVAATARTANEAMQPAITLLTARDRLKDEAPPDPNAAPTSGVLVVPGLAASAEAWAAQGKA